MLCHSVEPVRRPLRINSYTRWRTDCSEGDRAKRKESMVTGDALAFWVREPGLGELRPVRLPRPGPDDVVVRTMYSGISRGTEALVFRGGVPKRERVTMRAPFQDGEFPGPVKYGYLNVGVVESGPEQLLDRVVFCLYPHQTRYVVPASAVTPVPTDVPARRAVLAGTVETAVNALWDAAPRIGDRVSVVGAGMVGCCVARLLAGIPGASVTLVDVNTERARTAADLGVAFATPDDAPDEQDIVLHASATAAGLQRGLDSLAVEGVLVELSWYGDGQVTVSLGGAFHSRRLALRASQVGAVAADRRVRRSSADRLALAMKLLQDSAFDTLITGASAFAELPTVMEKVTDGSVPALCHVITYDDASHSCSA